MTTSRKIKIYTFLSLDGFVSRMDGDIDWALEYPRPAKGGYGFDRFYESVGSVIMTGMYYTMLQAQDIWPFEGKPCRIVCSRSFHTQPGHHVEFILTRPQQGDDVIESLRTLKGEPGGDVWLAGDHELTTLLLEHGLIDEIIVNLIPRTLGNGLRLFNHNGTERDWVTACVKQYDNGVSQLRYTVSPP